MSVNVKTEEGLLMVAGKPYDGSYVTPEMFGAVGDGETDDTEAFKAAMSSGHPCLISTKKYAVKNILLENIDGVTIYGNNAVLYFPDETNNKKWLSFVDCKNITIDGIVFDGNRENQTIVKTGVAGKDVTENCPAILLDNVENARITNCTFIDCQADGIQIDKIYYDQVATKSNVSRNVYIANNTFDKVGRNGVSVCHADGCIIIANIFRNISLFSTTIACGIDVEPNPEYEFVAVNVDISNNIFENCEFGINLSLGSLNNNSHDISVSNNLICSTVGSEYGIYLSGREGKAYNVDVRNNDVSGTHFGIYGTSVYKFKIINNNVHDLALGSTTYGGGVAVFFDKISYCEISKNIFESIGIYTAKINSAENTVIAQNEFKGDSNSESYIILTDSCVGCEIVANLFSGNKIPIFLRNQASDTKITDNHMIGSHNNIDITSGRNIVKYNNQVNVINQRTNITATTEYSFTGISFIVSKNSKYVLSYEVPWVNHKPRLVALTTSATSATEGVIATATVADVMRINVSGVAKSDMTLYLWCAYSSNGEGDYVDVVGRIED